MENQENSFLNRILKRYQWDTKFSLKKLINKIDLAWLTKQKRKQSAKVQKRGHSYSSCRH